MEYVKKKDFHCKWKRMAFWKSSVESDNSETSQNMWENSTDSEVLLDGQKDAGISKFPLYFPFKVS